MNIKQKYLGGMIGCALGDAIGELAFHCHDLDDLYNKLNQLKMLRYTDDTSMSIGLAESIVKMGHLDQQDLGETFKHNFQREPWRGYASGPPTIFSMVDQLGITYAEAARTLFGGAGSLGNGAAMRIAPIGLFYYNSKDLYEKACNSASVTHTHPIGMDGAAVQAKAISIAVQLGPRDSFSQKEFIDRLIHFSRTFEIKKKMLIVRELINTHSPPFIAAERLGRTVSVDESMPFAIYSFLRHSKSFEDCLFCATLNGGDRDTLGAMACSISGAYLGHKYIPKKWREKLENRSYIENLASQLSDTRNKKMVLK